MFAAAAVLLFAAAGCSGISKKYPERKYYMFDVPLATVNTPLVNGAVAQVWKFNVSPGSEGKEFIYRTSDIGYESDFYNQFFRPPGAMLTETTTRFLGSSGLFREVLNTVSQGYAGYYVEANVIELYGDFRGAPEAVMSIQFFLLEYVTENIYDDNTAIVFGKTYSSRVPIPSTDAGDLMRGWNTALGTILNDFLSDLKVNVKPAAAN